MSKVETYYHYTTRVHNATIEECGFLKLSESNVSMEEAHLGPDVVWLFKEPLTVVPLMMYSPLMLNANEVNTEGVGVRQLTDNDLQRMFMGMWVPKTEIEITVSLPRDEVVRADKFLKKHNADPDWIKNLEHGTTKMSKQYVITREVMAEEFIEIRFRKDLMSQRKHSYRDWRGNPVARPKKGLEV